MALVASIIQQGLKRICRLIQYLATVGLLLLFIYLNCRNNGPSKAIIAKRDSELPTKIACPANTFSSSEGCSPCPRGTFSFSGWSVCQPWLNCTVISTEVLVKKKIAGFTKQIWLAEWKGYPVVFVNCSQRSDWFMKRCKQGIQRMELLQGPFVTRLIGICHEKMVTAYYKHGSAKFLNKLLEQSKFSRYNNIQTRLQLSVDYVTTLNYLHNSPIGVRVMCDTATARKTLAQYLITDDFHLIVNDLDNLPEVNRDEGKFVKCSNFKESRESVAPEQRWPYISTPFRLELMPAYDEKVDIWKIPAVLVRLLGNITGSAFAQNQLREMMKKCLANDPSQRPTANEVLQTLTYHKDIISVAEELGPVSQSPIKLILD